MNWTQLKSKPKACQRISFSQPKKSWMIMIHNSMVCLRGPLLYPAASWGVFFETFPLPFPLLKSFSCIRLVSFFYLKRINCQKCSISQKIWFLFKTRWKDSTQTIFQGGSPWAALVHNSMVCLRGSLLCPAASWGDVFFETVPLPFPLLFFLLLGFILLVVKTKGFPKDKFQPTKKTMNDHDPQ